MVRAWHDRARQRGDDGRRLRRPSLAGLRQRRRRPARRRLERDDMVAAHLQVAQQGRQHRRRRRPGVVEEDDARMMRRAREQAHHAAALGIGRHLQPVCRPEVAPEHGHVARVQDGEQRRRVGEAREAEERHVRRGRARIGAVAGALVGGDAVVDVGLGRVLVEAAQGEGGMRHRMVADRVALGDLAPHQRGSRRGVAPNQEEGRADAFVAQRVEHARRRTRPRPVVEGQHHLVVGEREGLRVGLEPDMQGGRGGVDLDHARRAERARPRAAGHGRRRHGLRRGRRRDGAECHRHQRRHE